MKRIFLILLFITLTSCGTYSGNNYNNNSNNNNKNNNEVNYIYYNVNYECNGGSSISPSKVKEGDSISKPEDPYKDGYTFYGWYYDINLTKEVSFPLNVNEDLTLYAKYLNNIEYFLTAREKTLSNDGWKYQDKLQIKTLLGAVGYQISGPSGTRDGTISYSKGDRNSFYENFTYSGALFYDGESHTYNSNNTIYNVRLDEDGVVNYFKKDSAPNGYTYETSTYAKAIFEYDESSFNKINYVSKNKYEIKAKATASNILSLLLTNINSKFITKYISALKYVDVEPDYSIYVTYKDGYISNYSYEFNANCYVVGQLQNLKLTYELDFMSYSKTNISVPSFNGLATSKEEITSYNKSALMAINDYMKLENSSYDYEVHTDIDDLDEEFSITVKGKTIRKIINNKVYFDNKILFDQKNYTDSDGKEYDDYDGYRGVLKDGSVYDVKDPKIGFNSYEDISSLDITLDEFYFLGNTSNLLSSSNYSLVEEENKNNIIKYEFSLNDSGVSKRMDFISSSIRFSPLNGETLKVFGVYDSSSFNLKKYSYIVEISSNVLKSVTLKVKGEYETSLGGYSGETDFSFSIEIDVTDEGKNYSPSENKKDLEDI